MVWVLLHQPVHPAMSFSGFLLNKPLHRGYPQKEEQWNNVMGSTVVNSVWLWKQKAPLIALFWHCACPSQARRTHFQICSSDLSPESYSLCCLSVNTSSEIMAVPTYLSTVLLTVWISCLCLHKQLTMQVNSCNRFKRRKLQVGTVVYIWKYLVVQVQAMQMNSLHSARDGESKTWEDDDRNNRDGMAHNGQKRKGPLITHSCSL